MKCPVCNTDMQGKQEGITVKEGGTEVKWMLWECPRCHRRKIVEEEK